MAWYELVGAVILSLIAGFVLGAAFVVRIVEHEREDAFWEGVRLGGRVRQMGNHSDSEVSDGR